VTKYSNTLKKPDQYVKGLREHWKRQRTDKRYFDKRNTAVNDCWKPSSEASRADLAEYHREEMRLKKARRRAA
jgi:hypothetical protein